MIYFILFAVLIGNEILAEPNCITELIQANNKFAFNLLTKTFRTNGNVFFSPPSIFSALGMLYRGARETTAHEIQQAIFSEVTALCEESLPQNIKNLLTITEKHSVDNEIGIVNGLVVPLGYQVLHEYKEDLSKYYNAMLKKVDFANQSEAIIEDINKWIREKTHYHITKIVDRLRDDSSLVLLNSFYFNVNWEKEFNRSLTKQEKFFNGGVDEVIVPTMEIEELFEQLYDYRGFHIVKFPYEGKDLSLVALLPLEREGLGAALANINVEELNDTITDMLEWPVFVKFPKFKVDESISLRNNLASLGMANIFTPKADFSGITKESKAHVTEFTHKSITEVNEGKTGVKKPFNIRPRLNFIFDHPFIFLIRDERTGLILYIGCITNL